MPTLQNTDGTAIISVPMGGRTIEESLSTEWLLTNSRGGYASSTITGCNTRRYHGLLIGSFNPPANRIMALANCLETIICGSEILDLATFEFNEKFAPEGFRHIRQFRRDVGVHFDYKLNNLDLTKSVYLLHDKDTVAVVYDFTAVQTPIDFILRPFVGLRDFHSLQKSYAQLSATPSGHNLSIHHNTLENYQLFLSCPSANFEKDEQWWFNFIYRIDRERGQDFAEDLWTPGFFKCRIDFPARIIFWATLCYEQEQPEKSDLDAVIEELRSHYNSVTSAAKAGDKRLETLFLAADQFITKRQTKHNYRTTILAGFPWFADWGRDAFISLPGLLLSAGRFDEAKSVLTTFAKAADEGMIPNRFDDRSDTAYFNSIDASLWFINAAFQYLTAADDSETFTQQLLPTIHWIMDSYHNGTRFGTHADADGLITAGSNGTQLTWMDAKYEGIAFTPRCGKPVEINALWYNALCRLAQFYAGRDIEAAKHYHSMAEQVRSAFCRLFWSEKTGYLNDCILPDGSPDTTLRPNQIFAVSLPFSPLPPQQQKAVVDVVQKNLLTPFGLRTLNTTDSRYKGIYTGPRRQRDEAYHQGTVWPYLIGPFVESYLKVNDFTQKSKEEAAGFIEPLLRHLTGNGCLCQIPEIFDGNAPQNPRGCCAQAWSVAELIRAYLLINS